MGEIVDLFNKKELTISFDRLNNKNEVNHELLYFKDSDKPEIKGSFVFGFGFFVNELQEQEFKKLITQNSLNFKIFHAYKQLRKRQKKVKISEIAHKIQDKRKDSMEINSLLSRILSLAYYLNWNLEKAKKDLEGDYYVEIPDKFLVKLKQRFNFEIIASIYENSKIFIFINPRGKLNVIFKEKDLFTKHDVEKMVVPILKKVFSIKKVILE